MLQPSSYRGTSGQQPLETEPVRKPGNSQGPMDTPQPPPPQQQLTGNGWGREPVQGQTRLLVALLLSVSVSLTKTMEHHLPHRQ